MGLVYLQKATHSNKQFTFKVAPFVNICKGNVIHLLGELVHHDQTILIPLLGPWEWSQEIKVQLLCYLALTLCCELLLHGPQVTVLTKPFASHIIPYQKKHSLRQALVPSIPWCLNDENSLFLSPSPVSIQRTLPRPT